MNCHWNKSVSCKTGGLQMITKWSWLQYISATLYASHRRIFKNFGRLWRRRNKAFDILSHIGLCNLRHCKSGCITKHRTEFVGVISICLLIDVHRLYWFVKKPWNNESIYIYGDQTDLIWYGNMQNKIFFKPNNSLPQK